MNRELIRTLVITAAIGVSAMAAAAVAFRLVRAVATRLATPDPALAVVPPLLAIVVAVGIATFGVLLARVTTGGHDQPTESPPTPPATAHAFVEIGNTATLAKQVERLFWERESWIYRRVERIAFIDHTLVRRRISVDFEIPAGVLEVRLDDATDRQNPKRYVPISVLRGWPPVLNLDLRDESGRPLPLLSRRATNALDEQVLRQVARHAMGDAASQLHELLAEVVHGAPAPAEAAFYVLQEGVTDHAQHDGNADPERYGRFLDLASLLIDSTLLWIPVDGNVGDRLIFKMAYDEPVRRRLLLGRSVLTTLSWHPTVVAFDVPHIGDANSYHLELDAPEGSEIIDARLTLSTDDPPLSRLAAVRAQLAALVSALERELAIALERPVPPAPGAALARNTEVLTRRAHLYITGDRGRATAQATLLLAPVRAGTLLASAVTGLLVAGTLRAVEQIQDPIFEAATAASPNAAPAASTIGFLLLAPGLLSYVLLRSTDHPFARRLVGGVRAVAVMAVLLSVATAGFLVWALAERDANALESGLRWSARAADILATILIVSLVLPRRRRWRRSD